MKRPNATPPNAECARASPNRENFLRTRQTKIIRLADASKLTADISQKLSVEEREFYNNLHDNSSKFSKTIIEIGRAHV